MRDMLEKTIQDFMDDYSRRNFLPPLWKAPRLRFGDARHPRLAELRRAVVPNHYFPEEILPGAVTLVSYFVPFLPEVGVSNRDGLEASDLWGLAYRATNAMAAELNRRLVAAIEAIGRRAAVPENIDYSRETLVSRWSQRHIAWLSGHGTFGVNNMLITDIGCLGRYFSVVSDLPVEHDAVVTEEYCAYRKRGACLACVRRCVNGALTVDRFDRHRCFAACGKNALRQEGAHVCGKCLVGVPCSHAKV